MGDHNVPSVPPDEGTPSRHGSEAVSTGVHHGRSSRREASSPHSTRRQLEVERDLYRIEADCAMRDYDHLEVDAGIMVRALRAIAEGRPNRVFDPWAKETAKSALAELEVACDL